MSSPLTQKTCVPCEGGIPPLTEEQRAAAQPQIPNWKYSEDGKWVERRFNLKTFAEALAVLVKIAELAELEQHHPDLHLTGYRHLSVALTTHAIGGLSENDVILAAKIDQLVDDAHDS